MKSDNRKGNRTPTKDLSDRRSVPKCDDLIVRYTIAEGSIIGFSKYCKMYDSKLGFRGKRATDEDRTRYKHSKNRHSHLTDIKNVKVLNQMIADLRARGGMDGPMLPVVAAPKVAAPKSPPRVNKETTTTPRTPTFDHEMDTKEDITISPLPTNTPVCRPALVSPSLVSPPPKFIMALSKPTYDLTLTHPEDNPWNVFPVLTRDAEIDGMLISFITFIQVIANNRTQKASLKVVSSGDLEVSEQVSHIL
jgi:hypothetical protein